MQLCLRKAIWQHIKQPQIFQRHIHPFLCLPVCKRKTVFKKFFPTIIIRRIHLTNDLSAPPVMPCVEIAGIIRKDLDGFN